MAHFLKLEIAGSGVTALCRLHIYTGRLEHFKFSHYSTICKGGATPDQFTQQKKLAEGRKALKAVKAL